MARQPSCTMGFSPVIKRLTNGYPALFVIYSAMRHPALLIVIYSPLVSIDYPLVRPSSLLLAYPCYQLLYRGVGAT